ncbi:RNA polymerase sigma factor [Faecalibacter rhinopitheci]|uniref:Sigma-70 family RNA polymerase sigma factor n=1 Tax=Faecalibacter rhinopitheci TaxID=2779678 RepID=A0A8J7FP96_9FLAO|nr:sigma-70 family RNA polymerase sigma factor [Faecalibacter rhinopitheci]MBF0598162.1 sigma-70 family RNA polymerase sigma factor [Faecalibacter rhinopitheci]
MTQQSFKDNVFVHKNKLFRFARRFLVSEDEAFDVVQDIMVKLWHKKDELSTIENIEAYAMRMVNNECINRLRKFETREAYKNNYTANQSTENYYEELKPIILDYINQLPDKQRAVIHLRDVEEYEMKEIAEMLSMEETAVRVNLTRARQKVKTQLNTFLSNETRRLKIIS